MKNHKCRICQKEKEYNEINFPKAGHYLEKICKKCKYQRNQERRNERYSTDPEFRKKMLDATEKIRLENQKERNEKWERRLKKSDEWKKNNPEKVKTQYKKKYQKYYSDISCRINQNMKNFINSKIKARLINYKLDFLDYTIKDLMEHIESQFKPGMSWENRKSWNIDHILPLCSFDIKEKGDEEFKKCWALSNLQPLWASENYVKGQKDKLLKKNPLTSDENGLE